MSKYRTFLYEIVTPIMAALIVVLNILEMFFILREKKKKKKQGVGIIYIINLCSSDIFVGLAMIVLKVMTQFQKTTLKDDAVAKEIYNIIKYCVIRISLFVSVFNLSALTIDRLFAIKFPFIHRKQGKQFAFKVCCGVWIASVVMCTTVYAVTRFYLHNISRYNNLVFPVATYTAFVIFVISYSVIFVELRKSSKRKTQKSTRANSATGVAAGAASKDETKKEFRFLKLALKTVAVFMVCWIPFSTCSLHIAIAKTCGGKNVETSLFTLAFFNSVINPFIYFSHVQNAVSKQLGKLHCCSFFINGRSANYQPDVSDSTFASKKTSTTSDGQ